MIECSEVGKQALEKFGVGHQINKTVEELLELSLALTHYLDDKSTSDEVLSEMADSYIMLSQMVEVFGVDNFQGALKDKLAKLQSIVDTGS